MAANLGDYRDIFDKKAFCHLATVGTDGRPQVTPVWCDFDGTHVLVNSAKGRQKDRNMRRDARVAIAVSVRRLGGFFIGGFLVGVRRAGRRVGQEDETRLETVAHQLVESLAHCRRAVERGLDGFDQLRDQIAHDISLVHQYSAPRIAVARVGVKLVDGVAWRPPAGGSVAGAAPAPPRA